MERARRLVPKIPLESDRVWRLLLAAVFLLGVLCRFGVHLELNTHPVGRLEQWSGTVPWFFAQTSRRTAIGGNWDLAGPNHRMTRAMAQLAPMRQWQEWAANRLPRGAPGVWLGAISYSLSGTLALYTIAGIFAGGLLGVLAAGAAARLFGDRRAGIVAGIIAASQGTLVLGSVIAGPWLWEALALAAVFYCFLRLRDDPANLAEWLLLGLVLAGSFWVRSIFLWGILLLPLALWRWRVRPSRRHLAAITIPVVLSLACLIGRNANAEAPLVPVVGYPGWAFAETTNPRAVLRPQPPEDPLLLAATDVEFPALFRFVLGHEEYRAALPEIMTRKLREFLGARDATWTFNPDYLRRRMDLIGSMTLRPYVTMALGWTAFLFLLFTRRLPREVLPVLGLLLLHALLFRTAGMDRTMLHLVSCLLIGGGLAVAVTDRFTRVANPFVFLTIYAAALWLLAVDDHARGSRYRSNEFAYASREFRRLGNERAARIEVEDYRHLRQKEDVLGQFWNQ